MTRAREKEKGRNQIRRKDRAVADEKWIEATLRQAPLAFVATAAGGQPFINSNLFVYVPDRHVIYFHTARKGRTRHNVEQNARVCLTVAEMGRLLPADVALEFSVEYSSVVVFGRASVISDESEATDALQRLLDKYFPHLEAGEDYRPPVPEELKRTSVFRLEIEEWSAKRKAVEESPGAVQYSPGPSQEDPPEAGASQAESWEARRGPYTISTDPGRLDVEAVHGYLSRHSYWAQGRDYETVERSLNNSLCFGVYEGEKQIGLGRAITDFATYAYVADVFILPDYRGRGLGKWLMQTMMKHPGLQGLRKWALHTRDAQQLYKRYGFVEAGANGRYLEFWPGDQGKDDMDRLS